jgi:hypothetical protein
MAQNTVLVKNVNEVTLVKLARELAMDVLPLETILEANQIDQDTWEIIQNHSRFKQLLETESAAWGSALNTQERVKLKAAAMLEEWLPEAFARMNDRQESLNAKTELGKLVRDLGGFSKNGVGIEGGGERFSVTINLGADNQIKFEKETAPKTIEGEVL